MDSEEKVILKCTKENNRLRVKIITPNYFNDHNCQFPRAIRVENRLYEVPASDIKLVEGVKRGFYRVNHKNIRIIGEGEEIDGKSVERIFEDESERECAICLVEDKFYVFGPCGHFYVCKTCSPKCSTCPICRNNIQFRIERTKMEN